MTDRAWVELAIGAAAGLTVRAAVLRWVWPLIEAWTVAAVMAVPGR